jgi:hypothetical protein
MYYSIWELHDFEFPMPLGTQSVIWSVHMLLMDYQPGFQEVSEYCYCLKCGPRIEVTPTRGVQDRKGVHIILML